MQILNTIDTFRQARRALGTRTLGLVPTMGALHQGHLSLVRAARAHTDAVAVSIFVNPTQFAPHEDFNKYPRTFERDCRLLEEEAVDLIFAPSPSEMYPAHATQTFVEVPSISDLLDGAFRPGHLRAVATVVAKLFHIVTPDFAFFGQKDAAQVATLQAMVRDLNFPLQLIVCPTVRDPDGLALSSRNQYLAPAQRAQALALSRALAQLQSAVEHGLHDVPHLLTTLRHSLQTAPGLRFEYAEIVSPKTLEPLHDLASGALIAVAAWAGSTRLIDNIVLPPLHPEDTPTTLQQEASV